MAFAELFKVYPCKNLELRAAARVAYEFGKTVALEQTAAMSIGVDPHAMRRQRQYVDMMDKRLESLHQKPIPDDAYRHPTRVDVDLSEPYEQFTQDGLPLNEDTQLLAEQWMSLAVDMSASQSAGLGGSVIDPDYERLVNRIAVIKQLLDEIESRGSVDLPETAFPGADLSGPKEKSTTKKYSASSLK